MAFSLLEAASDVEFVAQGTRLIAEEIRRSCDERGACILGLSGGSTPEPVYRALGTLDLPWQHVKLFLVDERYVPRSHPESNQRLLRETLLSHAEIPEENLVFPDTSLPIDDCIPAYANALQHLWSDHLPDLVVLGMGRDGHIASLFPPLSALALGDERLVLHTRTEHPPVHDRVSLSLNAIASAGAHVLLLQGTEKRSAWGAMLASTDGPERWPAKTILEHDCKVVARW